MSFSKRVELSNRIQVISFTIRNYKTCLCCDLYKNTQLLEKKLKKSSKYIVLFCASCFNSMLVQQKEAKKTGWKSSFLFQPRGSIHCNSYIAMEKSKLSEELFQLAGAAQIQVPNDHKLTHIFYGAKRSKFIERFPRAYSIAFLETWKGASFSTEQERQDAIKSDTDLNLWMGAIDYSLFLLQGLAKSAGLVSDMNRVHQCFARSDVDKIVEPLAIFRQTVTLCDNLELKIENKIPADTSAGNAIIIDSFHSSDALPNNNFISRQKSVLGDLFRQTSIFDSNVLSHDSCLIPNMSVFDRSYTLSEYPVFQRDDSVKMMFYDINNTNCAADDDDDNNNNNNNNNNTDDNSMKDLTNWQYTIPDLPHVQITPTKESSIFLQEPMQIDYATAKPKKIGKRKHGGSSRRKKEKDPRERAEATAKSRCCTKGAADAALNGLKSSISVMTLEIEWGEIYHVPIRPPVVPMAAN